MIHRSVRLEIFRTFVVLATPAFAQQGPAPQRQIDLARQMEMIREKREVQLAPVVPSLPQSDGGQDLDSFGIQQMLVCGPARPRYFRVVGDVSGFVANNVGLSRRNPSADSFLVGNFGMEYRRPFARRFQVDVGFQAAMFRYNEFGQLNFNSMDVGAGLTYHSDKLGGVDVIARYNFNALQGASSGETFFQNHTITAAVEKIFQFSKAHYAVLGASGRVAFTDPRSNERHEVGTYAGYHIEVIPRLDVDLTYRYGYYMYTAGGRRDHNHTVSLGARYGFTEHFSASASSFYVWDRSNQDAFSYNAGTLGGGLMFLLRF